MSVIASRSSKSRRSSELWKGVNVFSTTTDCAAEMVKCGRILRWGKKADADGPALPARKLHWNGCVGHRLDKEHAILAEHPDLDLLMKKMNSITTHMNKLTQSLDHARKVGALLQGQWTTLKAMGKTRWWSLFTLADSFWMNVQTLKYMRDSPRSDLVPQGVYNLTDADWKDIEIIREITMVFKLAQEKLEGEKYITGSLVRR